MLVFRRMLVPTSLRLVRLASSLHDLARNGDVASIYEIGRQILDKERSVDNEANRLHEAKLWLEISAENGHVESQFLLGVLLVENFSKNEITTEEAKTSQDVIDQINAIKKAARKAKKDRVSKSNKAVKRVEEKKQPESPHVCTSNCVHHNELGVHKVINNNDESNDNDGKMWLKRAARGDHGKAMCYLGNLYLAENTDEGIHNAILWYNRAAKLPQPSSDALFNLGTIYFEGNESAGIPADLPKSFEYFYSAALLGDISAQYWIGHCYLTGEGGCPLIDYNKSVEFFSKAANAKHYKAHYYLGSMYRSGLSSPHGNIEANKDLFLSHLRIAVDGDDDDAQYCMADLLMHGDDSLNIPEDKLKARKYYELASDQGNVEATVSLGALHYHGLCGLPKDSRKAFEIYNKAAEMGSKEAWRNLASMYHLGDGVPKSEETAKQIMKIIKTMT